MHRKPFCPTLEGSLEKRVVLDGAKPVVTTETLYQIDQVLTRAFNEYQQTGGTRGDLKLLMANVKNEAGQIPFGAKKLLPKLISDFNGLSPRTVQKIESKFANDIVKYVNSGVQKGNFNCYQSGNTHPTDQYFQTNGDVPSGSSQ